jgi:hypothetical protein
MGPEPISKIVWISSLFGISAPLSGVTIGPLSNPKIIQTLGRTPGRGKDQKKRRNGVSPFLN